MHIARNSKKIYKNPLETRPTQPSGKRGICPGPLINCGLVRATSLSVEFEIMVPLNIFALDLFLHEKKSGYKLYFLKAKLI